MKNEILLFIDPKDPVESNNAEQLLREKEIDYRTVRATPNHGILPAVVIDSRDFHGLSGILWMIKYHLKK